MKFRIVLILCMIFLLIINSVCFAKNFSDVPSDHWAYKYIDGLSNQGIINGYEDGTFNPNGKISRAEFFKLISVAHFGEDAFSKLTSSSSYGNWYEPYMLTAFNSDLLSDEYKYGDPNEKITRKEMIIVLGRFAKANIYESIVNSSDENSLAFTDFKNEDMNESDSPFANFAFSAKLIKGYDDGSFKPDNNMTRAEAATVVYRFITGAE